MQKYVIALYIRLSLEDYKYDSTWPISRETTRRPSMLAIRRPAPVSPI